MFKYIERKESGLKKIVIVPVVLLILLSTVCVSMAEECNATPWGEPLSAIEQVTFASSAGGVTYYTVNKVQACGISKIEDTRVTYGFREGKLYTTIVEIDKAKDVKNVISILMDSYGLPDHKKSDGWDIYRWETDDLKIKLKSQYSTDRIKIGTYYKPLAPKE
ncbi:MAG: hypothetical protein JEY79_16145 [Pseudodesulfovibrio sp.]|nr:hypothetical protein [Pseudodesulfovibrio sp.]